MRYRAVWIGMGVLTVAMALVFTNRFILKNKLSQPDVVMKQPGKANRLIHEKSPYLLRHAYDPVDWYVWSEEAFAAARKQNRPIFLSIGYASCFACYTMQREVFENPKIADQMNHEAINILVDREERPDVDRLYMTVTQTLTGSGGWPMSLYLTPERKPFYGATYLSPADFSIVLTRIHEVWEKDPQKLSGSGEFIAAYLEDLSRHDDEKKINENNLLNAGFDAFRQLYDPQFGGFGTAPKFPHTMILTFLLRYYDKTGNSIALQMTEKTLRQMSAGAIFDHVGFGFHRYSTDEQWRTPHFEKMLSDQALLATAYLEAYQITRDIEFSNTAKNILLYAQREMMSPEGGFYGAEDAASASNFADQTDKTPGTFYTWTKAELDKLLGPDDSPVFCYLFGVRPEGNSLRDSFNFLKNENILFTAHSESEAAIQFNKTQPEIHSIASRCLQKLRDQRKLRPHPIVDDKIILSWNALMISALAKAYEIFGESSYLQTALRCDDFLRQTLLTHDGTLLRRYREGDARIDATLQDYAFYIQALLDLYEASFDIQHLERAIELCDQMLRLFYDPAAGAFFDTSVDDRSLPVRTRDFNDDSEPSGNSIAILDLIRISEITGNKKDRGVAQSAVKFFAQHAAEQPEAMPQFLTALQMSLEKPKHIIIAGKIDDPLTAELLGEIRSRFLPGTTVLLADGSRGQTALAKFLPVISSTRMLQGKPAAYVCENFVCKLPTSDPHRLAEMLDNKNLQ